MYELKTNTAVRVPVGPLVDPTDGKTIEGALTVSGMTAEIEYIDGTGGGAVTRIAFTPAASGSSNDMALVASSAHGVYDLELTAANVNWLGSGRMSFYDIDGFLVHYIDLQVVSANYYDNKFGTTIPNVNLSTIKTQTVTCAAGVTVNPSIGAATIQPTQTQLAAAFTEIKGATWASGTDTLEHIRDKQTDIETDTAEIGAAGVGLTAVSMSAAGVDAVHDEEVDNDGTAISQRGAWKLILAVLAGKSSGGGTTTAVFRDINDAKNRISATVDASGNRTAVGTRDAT